MARATPEELQEGLDQNTATLHLCHIGRMAWVYIGMGYDGYEPVLESAKDRVRANFKKVYTGWDDKRIEEEIDKQFPPLEKGDEAREKMMKVLTGNG